jgi:hypothetical protein
LACAARPGKRLPGFLAVEQSALARDTPAITGKPAILPHGTVTGNCHCDGIRAQALATARMDFGIPIRLAISA